MNNFQEFLKSCSKDESSYQKLMGFVQEIVEERESAKTQLNLLEDVVRSDYDSILITTLELEKPGPKIVYVNDGFTRMTGYTPEEVIGKTPRILQGPKTDRKVLDRLKSRLTEGRSFFGHTVNYRKDGSEFIIQWDIHPLTNERGEVTHWVSYQHDITERKRSEEKVVDSQIEFDSLNEESKKTLIDIDEQGNILNTNKAFRNLTGYEEEELKKRKIWDLLVDEQVEKVKTKFEEFTPDNFQGATYELKIKSIGGSVLELRVKTRFMEIDDQKVVRTSIENKSLQKRIIAMLDKRNKSYRKMYDRLKDYKYKLTQNDEDELVFDYVSDTFSYITGISADKAEGMPVQKLIHEDDFEKAEAHLKQVLSGKPDTETFRIKRKEGDYSEVIDYAKPVWNSENDTVIGIKGATSTEISSVSESVKH